jgi:hypothetical protein
MKRMTIASLVLVAGASLAAAKSHTAADTNLMGISGGTTCPAGTTQVAVGSHVIYRNPNNGNLTEDARCWTTVPASTSQIEVDVLGPCVVCRFGP